MRDAVGTSKQKRFVSHAGILRTGSSVTSFSPYILVPARRLAPAISITRGDRYGHYS